MNLTVELLAVRYWLSDKVDTNAEIARAEIRAMAESARRSIGQKIRYAKQSTGGR